jgi:hypothetical protein
MAYQTALTIASVIKDIDSKKYLLPSVNASLKVYQMPVEK